METLGAVHTSGEGCRCRDRYCLRDKPLANITVCVLLEVQGKTHKVHTWADESEDEYCHTPCDAPVADDIDPDRREDCNS